MCTYSIYIQEVICYNFVLQENPSHPYNMEFTYCKVESIPTIYKKGIQMTYSTYQSTPESLAKDALDGFAKDWKIFIDTCSLLDDAADLFWTNIIPYLHLYKNKVIIPLRSIDELEKFTHNMSKPNLADKSKDCIKKIQQLQNGGFVEIRGESTDNFTDNVLQVVFTKFRMTHNLLLITQDNNLAKDILALNNNRSVRANPVQVKKINRYGFLSSFHWDSDTPYKDKYDQDKEVNASEVFRICKQITPIKDTKLMVSCLPAERELAYSQQGSVKLESKIAEGGEGIIYSTNTPYVAKIYKRESLTKRRYEKIRLMLSKKIKYEGICYPVEELYNSNKEFVGFLMPKAKGKELQKSIFIKPLFLKTFPSWKKRDTVELCITILKKIKYLHDRNIIMGDINPSNIMIVSPKEVYFVDTDSYQIEDFPCPVGTNNYTAPEIQRKHFSDFLRTMGNENFAVATLLFMIMLPGKPPYSQQGGEDPINNIINMDFSYPFGDNSNKKTPDGPWRFIWSHLTYELKGAFYNTFRKGGEHSTEDTRLSADEWLSIFSNYLELLDSGKYGQQDKMSEELFPTRHKMNTKVDYITCKMCKKDVPEYQCQNGICPECLNKGEIYRCKRCRKEILYTNYQKYVKKGKPFDLCPECFDYGNRIRIRQTCVECGRQFDITNSEYEFFTGKGLDLPKRCKSCRDAKKDYPYGSFNDYNTSDRNIMKSKGSFCFISTVICNYYGKEDDCDELNILRNFRDKWLSYQPGGQELISEYYNTAPYIVSKLLSSPNYDIYCQYLWDRYLLPCLKSIENEQYESCKEQYIKMYQYLEKELL